jgi:hypothetical protein
MEKVITESQFRGEEERKQLSPDPKEDIMNPRKPSTDSDNRRDRRSSDGSNGDEGLQRVGSNLSSGGYGAIILQHILKKKNRFGLYYKRLLTLTDEPKLGCSADGLHPFKKTIELSEETKLVRLDQTRFKISYPGKSIPGSTAKKVEKVTTLKASDVKQCEEWIMALTTIIEIVKDPNQGLDISRRSAPNTGALSNV